NLYYELGLTRRARRLLLKANDSYRRSGAVGGGLATNLWMLSNTEHTLGYDAEARAHVLAAVEIWSASLLMGAAYRPAGLGSRALWESEPAKAASLYEEAVRESADADEIAIYINALVGASEAHLAAGDAAAALAASKRAATIHREHGLADIQGIV